MSCLMNLKSAVNFIFQVWARRKGNSSMSRRIHIENESISLSELAILKINRL